MCNTNCYFVWHGVVPPTHCPNCGRCLGCGGPAAVPPYPLAPWVPTVRPYWSNTGRDFTYTTTYTTTS